MKINEIDFNIGWVTKQTQDEFCDNPGNQHLWPELDGLERKIRLGNVWEMCSEEVKKDSLIEELIQDNGYTLDEAIDYVEVTTDLPLPQSLDQIPGAYQTENIE